MGQVTGNRVVFNGPKEKQKKQIPKMVRVEDASVKEAEVQCQSHYQYYTC